MSQWYAALSVDALPEGAAQELVIADQIIALFHTEKGIFALDGICPHQGGPLGSGALQGCIVTCPWHGWQFDVSSGQHQASQSLKHQTFEVKVEAGQIMVHIPEEV